MALPQVPSAAASDAGSPAEGASPSPASPSCAEQRNYIQFSGKPSAAASDAGSPAGEKVASQIALKPSACQQDASDLLVLLNAVGQPALRATCRKLRLSLNLLWSDK